MARSFARGSSQVAYCATPVTAAPLSVAGWFNTSDITNQQFLFAIVRHGGGSGGQFFAIELQGYVAGDPIAATAFGSSVVSAVTTTGFTQNTWHHACAVFASTTSRSIYLDGGGKATNTSSCSPSNVDRLSIGTLSRSDNPNVWFTGLTGEWGVWNVALTDAEVAILAKGVSPLLVRPQSLAGYWPLIGRTDPEIELRRGLNMTLANAPTVAEHPRVLYAPRLWNGFSSAATVTPPDAPTALTATATASDTIALAWTDNSTDETGFKIERGTDGVTFALIHTTAADATSYNDATCAANTLYYYRVCATNEAGDSAYTNVASAKTPPADAHTAYKHLVLVGGQVQQTDGRYLALVDGVPEPDTVLGVTWLYVDQTTGDLTVKFGDGHTATVAADS